MCARCTCTKIHHALGPVCILALSSAFRVQPFWCVRQLLQCSVLYSTWAYHKCCDLVYKWFLPSPFPLMFSVWRVSAFFPATWGLLAGLPGFPSHGKAGCQKWKLLGITGTQPPLSNAVVNFILGPLLKLPVAAFLSHVHCMASARNTQAINFQPVEHGSLNKILHNDTSFAVQTFKD